TGGSGLAGALGRWFAERTERGAADAAEKQTERQMERQTTQQMERQALRQTEQSDSGAKASPAGRAVLLAGSCSAITLKQIADFQEKGYPSLQIRPQKLWDRTQTKETIWQWLKQPDSENGLVYSSAAPEDIKKSQELGRERIAALIEETLSGLAAAARDAGYTRFIIAGGETSGAVTKALGYEAFYIGPSVAPGVPVMTPLAAPDIRLVLKSGNFGQTDFFARALEMTLQESRRV
ncbi:MAG: nucleotide-binding domain containing protein, partial [Eubacteriales bacterium]|nr:nucleotide-binding domain containing protein [Eubacteriales bacterium]